MGKADLHIHTTYSHDGSSTIQAVLDWAAGYAGLDIIAITDHDQVEGGLRACDLAEDYGVQVIPGSEISTRDGHLLAYFIHERIEPGLPLIETVLRVAEQGGICAAAHPMARGVNSLSHETVRRAVSLPEVRACLVAAEAYNSGLVYLNSNLRAQWMCADLGLSPTGGSDAHVLWTVGNAVTEFPGESIADLRAALINGSTRAVPRISGHSLQFFVSNIQRRLMRHLGWVTWTPEPRAGFVTARLNVVQR